MNLLKRIYILTGSGFTTSQYYRSMNMALKRLNNEYTMLHYPYYGNESDSFIQGQRNLTDYCISLLTPVENKIILEIGCGNGVQAMYIKDKYKPLSITGVDLNQANIEIANSEKERINTDKDNIIFHVDDAQNLSKIRSGSIDVLLNIESAFHYPDKSAFLKEVCRVLKPGGEYLIADILSTRPERNGIKKLWSKTMVHHFWTRKKYEDGFLNSDLEIKFSEDITPQIKKGWQMYPKWMPKLQRKMFFQNLAYRIFYYINVKLNIYFLNSSQQYVVYVGQKPSSR
jgi:ubiquinone/menaquinone biosynthesis C-methylase UbiE